MARRPSRVEPSTTHAAKAKRPAPARAPKQKTPAKAINSVSRANELESDNVRLTAELSAALLEIAALKKRQDEIANRLDWVIDSLHSLLRDGG